MNKKINWEELQLNLEIFQKHAGSTYDLGATQWSGIIVHALFSISILSFSLQFGQRIGTQTGKRHASEVSTNLGKRKTVEATS